ncbi:hypothetical protein FBU30_008855 [Linnemannia zychae]|nr:hypothetical protein FBU30_008855 [Linnemannia zychae]
MLTLTASRWAQKSNAVVVNATNRSSPSSPVATSSAFNIMTETVLSTSISFTSNVKAPTTTLATLPFSTDSNLQKSPNPWSPTLPVSTSNSNLSVSQITETYIQSQLDDQCHYTNHRISHIPNTPIATPTALSASTQSKQPPVTLPLPPNWNKVDATSVEAFFGDTNNNDTISSPKLKSTCSADNTSLINTKFSRTIIQMPLKETSLTNTLIPGIVPARSFSTQAAAAFISAASANSIRISAPSALIG